MSNVPPGCAIRKSPRYDGLYFSDAVIEAKDGLYHIDCFPHHRLFKLIRKRMDEAFPGKIRMETERGINYSDVVILHSDEELVYFKLIEKELK